MYFRSNYYYLFATSVPHLISVMTILTHMYFTAFFHFKLMLMLPMFSDSFLHRLQLALIELDPLLACRLLESLDKAFACVGGREFRVHKC